MIICEEYTGEYTTNYSSDRFYPGASFINRRGITAKVLGKTLVKYSRVFVIEYEDGLIGTTDYSGLINGGFVHPINFSIGNNSTNKYKTIYKRWEQIRERCSNPRNKSYPRYGAKGIECRLDNFYLLYFELRKDPKFEALLDQPDRYDVDRIDNNGHYESGNLRIATKSENLRNTSRNYVYTLLDNYTDKLLFTGIKKDCETWIAANLGVKTSIDWRTPKRKMGQRNGFSVRHELAPQSMQPQ